MFIDTSALGNGGRRRPRKKPKSSKKQNNGFNRSSEYDRLPQQFPDLRGTAETIDIANT